MDLLNPGGHLFTALQLVTAVALGALIGYERQRRQRMAGLRTNALVALGSCAFVLLGIMMPDEISPTRVAAQVVSGIGFLCAGVIMRDGFNVRGLNTAATLWCSAAVGVLVGSAFFVEGALVALTLVAANTVLRPLAARLNREPVDEQTEFEAVYSLRVICPSADKAHVRALLMQTMDQGPLTIRSLHSAEQSPDSLETEAEFVGVGENSAAMERLVSRLSLEESVSEVSWRFLGESQVPVQNMLSREGVQK